MDIPPVRKLLIVLHLNINIYLTLCYQIMMRCKYYIILYVVNNVRTVLYECISFVFTCMIKHSIAPSKFGIATIVPIHKESNLKASETKNYRDVSLSSLYFLKF